MKRGRGDFFVSLTLTDFVLTLLFLMLLLALWSLRERAGQVGAFREQLGACQSQAARCDQQLAAFLRKVEEEGFDPDEPNLLARLKLVDLRKWQRLEEAEQERDRLAQEKQALEQEVAKLTPHDAQGNPIDVGSLRERLDEVEGRLAGCARQMEQCGLGLPPCWADAAGRVEYLYTVTIHEDGLSVEPRWSAAREQDATSIPGATALRGERMPLAEFQRRAAPVLAWSEQNACRHYVYVLDGSETKEAFKRHLFAVEDYFYKYVERTAVR